MLKSSARLQSGRHFCQMALIAYLFVMSRSAWASSASSHGDQPAVPVSRLCDLLTKVQPGEKLTVVVSGTYQTSYEVDVLYDPDQRLCDYDVQPSTAVTFSKAVPLAEGLQRVLHKDYRAFVTVRGVLWGPPLVPADNPAEPALVTTLNRVASPRGYGHMNFSRTKLEVEEVLSWRRMQPGEPNWGTGGKLRPISSIPVVQSAALPKYPRFALHAGVGGEVIVEVIVKDGKVAETKVQSGDRMLVPEVLENIATWAFKSDANAHLTTKFTFELELRKTGADQNLRIELNLPTSAKIVAPLRAN